MVADFLLVGQFEGGPLDLLRVLVDHLLWVCSTVFLAAR